jgi:hypothetical protein
VTQDRQNVKEVMLYDLEVIDAQAQADNLSCETEEEDAKQQALNERRKLK